MQSKVLLEAELVQKIDKYYIAPTNTVTLVT